MKRIIYGFFGILLSVGIFILPVTVNASPFDSARDTACQGLEFSDGDSTTCDTSDGTKINSTVATAINLISLVVGFVSVIMVIVGGLKYTTSHGDSSGISSAKDTILYAIIGLIIVAMAQLMVRFVLSKTADNSSDSPGVGSSINDCAPGQTPPC
ncbi:hypothetical protein KC960_04390 [Candidatus Saccharibacteria bacterium]|nr:hypothetical protein [Candidatus Saccharibacteria bacterium]